MARFFRSALISIVFVVELDRLLIDLFDPVIGDGYAMRIPGEVFNHMLNSGKRLFGVYHPILSIKVFFPGMIAGRLGRKVRG